VLDLRVQLELFPRAAASAGEPAFDARFRGLRRIELAHGAWVDHVPAWVAHDGALFDRLRAQLAWRSETRRMYTRDVATPRLLAGVPPDAIAGLIEAMRVALSARYGEDFVRTTAALYRDGADSVAYHGDTTARELRQATVATVSLGAPRRFRLRPTEAGTAPSIALDLGGGDLVVMGGSCQRTWRHGIAKVARADARIALMFRPRWGERY
jgi:alkylated DNA repair dioxygenase AlkB